MTETPSHIQKILIQRKKEEINRLLLRLWSKFEKHLKNHQNAPKPNKLLKEIIKEVLREEKDGLMLGLWSRLRKHLRKFSDIPDPDELFQQAIEDVLTDLQYYFIIWEAVNTLNKREQNNLRWRIWRNFKDRLAEIEEIFDPDDLILEAIGDLLAGERHCQKNLKLTERSLDNLRHEDIPEKVLSELEPLTDQEFARKEPLNAVKDFWQAVEKQIGKEQAIKYEGLILKYGLNLSTCLFQIVRGKVSHLQDKWRRRKQNEMETSENKLQPVNKPELYEKIIELVTDDKLVKQMVELQLNHLENSDTPLKPQDIAVLLKKPIKEIYNATKRLKRRLENLE